MAKFSTINKKIKSVTLSPIVETTATQYFMDVKNGKRIIEYLHTDLEPILKDSNGIFQYQEEVMRFLVEIAGYTWEESDIIRSAIAKKKHDVIMSSFKKIRESCSKRGWSASKIETICQQIQAFSRYSFNKSHSYAYAELGYITLYLKNHYPLEWWCGVLNNEDKEDKTRMYISYLGNKITSPSLKNPSDSYSIYKDKIVAPISAIKSVGPASVKELMAKGPFISLEDYIERIDHARVNIGAMSAIIKARAADELMESFSDELDFAEHINGVKTYIEARKDFMLKYLSLKKGKTTFKDDMWNVTPIDIFLQEKEYNKSFNKSLLSDHSIQQLLMQKWPGLKSTQRVAIPFIMNNGLEETPILSGIKMAQAFALKSVQQEVGMILLFQSSSYREGISKKSGRPWRKVDVILSDGYNNIEVSRWDANKAFGWAKDTVVYVRGTPKIGWRGAVTMNIEEIEKVE